MGLGAESSQSAETTSLYVGEGGSILAGSDGRLRNELEAFPDFGRAVAGREDARIGNAHLRENAPEVGLSVIDAHGEDEVFLLAEHAVYDMFDGCRRVLGRSDICPIRDDHRDRTRRDVVVGELLLFRQRPAEDDRCFVVERSVAVGAEGRAGKRRDVVDEHVWRVSAFVERFDVHQDAACLLGILESLQSEIGSVDEYTGVSRMFDRRGVIEEECDDGRFTRLDVIDADAHGVLDLGTVIDDLERPKGVCCEFAFIRKFLEYVHG